jgi:predicted metal-dependent hydrolase
MAWKEVPTSTHAQKRELKQTAVARIKQAKAEGTYERKADWGKQYVYKCERQAYERLSNLRFDMDFESLQRSTTAIFADERVRAIDPYPAAKVVVELSTKNGANARTYERRMRFGTARDNFALLHEIAHILTPNDLHGKEFQRMECKLFEWFLGPKAGEIMRFFLGIREGVSDNA